MCIWGTSFPLVKMSLKYASPFLFLGIRFLIGGVLLYIFLLIRKYTIQWALFKKALPIGIFLFAGMQMQTIGLKYTDASKSAFITALCVVFVPFLVILIERKMPKLASIMGVFLATAGIYFLTNPRSGSLNRGDLFTLIAALSFAFEIVWIEMAVRNGEAESIALFTVLITALLAFIGSLVFEKAYVQPTSFFIVSILFIALFCTALGFLVQMIWQPKTTATAAGIIYTTEPVFAALFAMWMLHERMSPKGWVGAGLIVSGMLVAELRK